jgi:hypothetical protein
VPRYAPDRTSPSFKIDAGKVLLVLRIFSSSPDFYTSHSIAPSIGHMEALPAKSSVASEERLDQFIAPATSFNKTIKRRRLRAVGLFLVAHDALLTRMCSVMGVGNAR